eukprot:2354500-Amphidinium_carterae.1
MKTRKAIDAYAPRCNTESTEQSHAFENTDTHRASEARMRGLARTKESAGRGHIDRQAWRGLLPSQLRATQFQK